MEMSFVGVINNEKQIYGVFLFCVDAVLGDHIRFQHFGCWCRNHVFYQYFLYLLGASRIVGRLLRDCMPEKQRQITLL